MTGPSEEACEAVIRAEGWLKLSLGWTHPNADSYPGFVGDWRYHRTARGVFDREFGNEG